MNFPFDKIRKMKQRWKNMRDLHKKRWFEKEWFLHVLWIGGMVGLFKLSLIEYELYKPFFGSEQKSDLLLIININFILGLGVLGSFFYLYLTVAEIIKKKRNKQPLPEPFGSILIGITCIVAYFLRFKTQFDMISEHMYQDNSFIVMEIAITFVSLMMASMISLVILLVVLKLVFTEEEDENKEKPLSIKTSTPASLEEEFPEFLDLEEKVEELLTYEDGISKEEIDAIYHDFEELYARYVTLPFSQQEEAYTYIVKAIRYQENDIQKRIDAIYDKQLEGIKRKVNRMMNNA